jgi:hypothetical protein
LAGVFSFNLGKREKLKLPKKQVFPNTDLAGVRKGKKGKVFRLYYIYICNIPYEKDKPKKKIKTQKCFPFFPNLTTMRDTIGKS